MSQLWVCVVCEQGIYNNVHVMRGMGKWGGRLPCNDAGRVCSVRQSVRDRVCVWGV